MSGDFAPVTRYTLVRHGLSREWRLSIWWTPCSVWRLFGHHRVSRECPLVNYQSPQRILVTGVTAPARCFSPFCLFPSSSDRLVLTKPRLNRKVNIMTPFVQATVTNAAEGVEKCKMVAPMKHPITMAAQNARSRSLLGALNLKMFFSVQSETIAPVIMVVLTSGIPTCRAVVICPDIAKASSAKMPIAPRPVGSRETQKRMAAAPRISSS